MGSIVGFMLIVGGMIVISPIAFIVSKTKWFNKFLDDLMDKRI